MQQLKKHLPLVVIVGVLFVTGSVFANAFISNVGSATVLGEEDDSKSEVRDDEDEKDEESDSKKGDKEVKDNEDDEKDEVKEVKNKSLRNGQKAEDDEDVNESDENGDVEDLGELKEDILKMEARIDALSVGGADVSVFLQALEEVKSLVTQAEKKAVSDPKGAEVLLKSADKKLERLEKMMEIKKDDEEEGDEEEDDAKEYKNEVAQFVHDLKELGEIDGGIGQKVRLVAQAQNDATDEVENSINEINDRSGFAKFFVGPKYGSLAEVQAAIVENQTRIGVLNDLAKQVTDPVVRQILQDEITQFQQENTRLQLFVTENENGFSLFGWLAKLLG